MFRSVITPLTLLVFLLALTPFAALANPGRMDPAKRASQIQSKRAEQPELLPIEQNARIQNRRFEAETLPLQKSSLGNQTWPLLRNDRLQDSRFNPPDRPEDPRISPEASRLQSQHFDRWSPDQNRYPSRQAQRIQEKLEAAHRINPPFSVQADKRATFEEFNRFAMRRNGAPGPGLVQAASEQPPVELTGLSSPPPGSVNVTPRVPRR